MKANDTTASTDLFGNPIDAAPVDRRKPRPVTNDMDLIERVLQIACREGYALVGPAERVYRIGPKDPSGAHEVVGVPADEANAVHQLVSNKDLIVGGQHRYRYRNSRESYGRLVLVPRNTRYRSARWAALHRPSNWSTKDSPERKVT